MTRLPTALLGWLSACLCALALAGCGAALMLAGAVWYGLSRASAPGSKYVPARIDGTEITPGHMEPRR